MKQQERTDIIEPQLADSGNKNNQPFQQPPPARDSQAAPPKEAPRSRRKFVLTLVVVAALAASAYFVWRAFFAQPKLPDSIVALSGRVEGDDSAISPKTSGRILEIRFREGDAVKAGDIIAILSDEQIRAREEQAQAAVAIMEARGKAARDQIAVLQQQMEQNQLQTAQSKVDAEGRVRQAEAELAAAVAEANRRVEASKGALTTAKANLENPGIREAQVSMVRKQIIQQQSEVASADANTEQVRGQLREAQANRRDLVVVAPFDGVVVTRAAEPGEVVTAGTALVTIVDLNKVYLRGFVPEGQIGKVKLGQPAHVYLDSNPNRPVDAWVSRIDPQATFTPENTYFKDERVKQVVGVKLQLKGAIGFAKPGMPADGEILTQGDAWPEASRKK